MNTKGALLFDWGDTLMRDLKQFNGPMKDWQRVEVIPGAAEALALLQPDWTLALATNAVDSDEREIRAALQRVDLDRWLERVYCFKNIGHKKPSPQFFEHILADLKKSPEQVCMVGDQFDVDVKGANVCWIPAIWFNEHTLIDRHGDLYRTIHDLRDLPEVLKNFMPAGKLE